MFSKCNDKGLCQDKQLEFGLLNAPCTHYDIDIILEPFCLNKNKETQTKIRCKRSTTH
jgi:hypothetical protein